MSAHKRITCACMLVAALVASPGCGFSKLKKDLSYIEGNFAIIKGDVLPQTDTVNPVLVALWRGDDPNRTVLRYYLMQGRGSFQFLVNAPGEYRLMAFEDLNGDMARGEKEPRGILPQHGTLKVAPGQMVSGVQILMGGSDSESLPKIEVKPYRSGNTISAQNIKISLDEVTTLDDPRFSPENVEIGLWEPHRFILEIGGGIFFLESYDPNRMPVLFVHGANGSPRDWRFILEHMDKKKVQPWVAYYPSGMSLELTNQIFYRLLTELHLKYGFKQIGIVAHSMGGLLSKGFINELKIRNSPVIISVYVTLSTPWNGHETAEMGVKQAPAVVPSWWDVIPGSPYIKKLWQTPLPLNTRYYLLFGYSGKLSLMMNRNNDGVVTISSELYNHAQEAATGIRGFDKDHNSILSCQDAVKYLESEVFR